MLLDEGGHEKVEALEQQFFEGQVTEDVLFATGRGIAPWMASVTFGGPDLRTAWAGAIYNYEPGTAAAKEAQAKATAAPSGWAPFGGVPPKVRVERPAGQWQSFQIWFQPPRFDASGKKIANAKFLRVLFNGALIQENVERVSFTQAAPPSAESATGPIMSQGDHGPIAFRNIYVRPLRPLFQS